ncbi:MAG: methyltransferase domain-containing protein [Sphingobacteriaceae bacterium]|nr:methyltransferase domain-containing protein [Sphingobacteriaceae bacterium]
MGTEFNKEQFDAIYPEGIENHYWTHARNLILKHVLSKSENKNILEIGCGKGVVVNFLRISGYNISGVELADIKPMNSVKENVMCGTDVFKLSADKCNLIDTIMLLDVIEHLENPNSFILKLNEKFPSLKQIIITVPARQELFSNYDIFNGHFRRYDSKTLISEFSGLKTCAITISYFFHSLYIPAKALLNTKGKRSESIKAPIGTFSKFIHRLIALFFYIEYLLLPAPIHGTSLLARVIINK